MIVLIMTGLVIIVLLTVVFVSAAGSRETTEQRLRRQVIEADQQVHTEYLAARREMNNAAGQSWRNLIE